MWMILTVGVGRLLQIVGVAVMGSALSKGDFGLVAIALSISMYIQTFRDAGVRDYLVANQSQYDSLVGPCFWLSGWINVALALALGLAGEVAARVFVEQGKIAHATDLSVLVWIMAASVPLGSPSITMLARLKVDLRFGAIAGQATLASFLRYGAQIAFVLMGWGAIGFVLPVLLVPIADNIYLYAMTREKAWLKPAEPKRWRAIWSASKWIVLASVAAGIANQGFAVVAMPLLPADTALEVMGVLFFALSMHYAIELVVTNSLVQITLPVFSRLKDEPVRQAAASMRVLRLTMLIAAPFTIAASLVFGPAAKLVWGSKWDDAAMVMLILAPAFALRAATCVVGGPLFQSRHKFTGFFWTWAVVAVTALAGASIGALWLGTATGMAAVLSVVLCVAYCITTVRSTTEAGSRAAPAWWGLLLPLAICCFAGAGVYALSETWLDSWCRRVLTATLEIKGRTFDLHQGLRAVLVGLIYLSSVLVLLRVMAAVLVRDALDVLPQRLASLGRRALWL